MNGSELEAEADVIEKEGIWGLIQAASEQALLFCDCDMLGRSGKGEGKRGGKKGGRLASITSIHKYRCSPHVGKAAAELPFSCFPR